MKKCNITVWNEYMHERKFPEIANIYPEGIHNCIGDALGEKGFTVETAWLDKDEEHGLSPELLAKTDVLFWWGHMEHEKVRDDVVDRVQRRVEEGMGLVVLHSGHGSKIFKRLMGTNTGLLKWREDGEKEILWVVDPAHPIAAGIDEKIILPEEEMYGEHFNIPAPDAQVFISWFEGGEVFRSGCCWHRGKGKVFYFRPGHEAFPIYHNPQVQQILANAANWAAPAENAATVKYGNPPPVVDFQANAGFETIAQLHGDK